MDALKNTKTRLQSVLQLSRNLLEIDFPHNDSRSCLKNIISIFESNLEFLNKVENIEDLGIVNAVALAVSSKIFGLFPFLGFILRSTDVRNAFEIHGPFLHLVRKILGPDSNLIISSEWDYSPFTYIPPIDLGLSDTVFIGVPASESDNALIIPLAGHELGHNIWNKMQFSNVFGPLVKKAILAIIRDKYWDRYIEEFSEIKKPEDLEDILGSSTWVSSYEWSLRQCEEIFCDLIGIAIFKESFIYSFAYLLAPGIPGLRIQHYPGMGARTKYHEIAANKHGIKVPDSYVSLFSDEDEVDERPFSLLLNISDSATEDLVDELINKAFNLVMMAGIERASEQNIINIKHCFEKGIPAHNPESLADIINAGWAFSIENFKQWERTYPSVYSSDSNRRKMLSDLIYKSIEVLQIKTITEA